LLQIENEYYSYIRPKRTTNLGERPSAALASRGVEYVEVRALDVNCYAPHGVVLEQLYFIEMFLLFCLLEASPRLDENELHEIEYNELTVALRGRAPALELARAGKRVLLRDWIREICARMEVIAACLDDHAGNDAYRQALALQQSAIEAPDTLPSAQVLRALRDSAEEFHHYTMTLARTHHATYLANAPAADVAAEFASLAAASHAEQTRLEDDRSLAFEEFVRRYLDA
jgi:glutamate--cysteine ligase